MPERTRPRALAPVAIGTLLACVLVVVAGFGVVHGFGPRAVGSGRPPDRLPATGNAAGGQVCVSRAGDWGRSRIPAVFWVGVDAHPLSVTAVWWPPLGDPLCRVVSSHGGPDIAEALAREIRRSQPIRSGVYNCPNDAGGAVDLYFAYGSGHWERVRDYPTGCAHVDAAGRTSRRAFLDDGLAAIAPSDEWRRILR